MWQKSFQVTTKASTKEKIWQVLTDINHWNTWDSEIEWTKLEGELKTGTVFFLKPKGGPKVKLTVSHFEKTTVFGDISHLPLAKMYTEHRLTNTAEGVKINVTIKVTGLLTFLWSKVIAQKQIDGGVEQTKQLIEKAAHLEAG